jgi:hypothetical protein
MESWTVRSSERKQLLLVKIPGRIADKLNIHDGHTLLVTIRIDREMFRGPLTVTSGCEVYLPKNLRKLIDDRDFKISIQEVVK